MDYLFRRDNLLLFARFLTFGFLSSLTFSFVFLWFLGHIPDSSNLNLGSQFQFLSISLGIGQEVLSFALLPLVFSLKEANKKIAYQNFTFLLTLALLIGLVAGFLTFHFPEFLVKLSGVSFDIENLTIRYLKFSAFSFPFLMINTVILGFYRYQGKNFYLIYGVFYLIFSIFVNFLLFYPSPYSLNLGLDGLGYEKIAMSLGSFIFLLFGFKNLDWRERRINFTEWRKRGRDFLIVSKGLLIDSILRNFFYLAGILVWLNQLGGQESGFWFMTSSLFWGWYLLPVLALLQITQIRACRYIQEKRNYGLIIKLYKKAFLALSLILGGATLIFLTYHWQLFSFFNPLEISKKEDILEMGQYFLLVYTFFSFNMVTDTFFYAIGKTKYMAWQSLLSSFLVLALPLVLIKWEIINLSLVLIQSLYFSHLMVDLIFTGLFFRKELLLLKKN